MYVSFTLKIMHSIWPIHTLLHAGTSSHSSLYNTRSTEGIQLMKVTFLGLPTENVLLSVVVMGAVILICFGISVKCFKWE